MKEFQTLFFFIFLLVLILAGTFSRLTFLSKIEKLK